ncbi:RNase adapter RapZ [Moraxella bovis]|uniref:RNase adapter RapZ n=1 Tax=Moraxella bovis TaxID=476 RepID=UPI0022270DD5|nr:RNase adapter RapZ [Moraxella bovis]UYZ68602.1 RNase adapter RapZ [Moraxella bovis]UYZ70974.1 RNase adapter RapZ [Moraxella bovis]UYZ73104.1 RNase adapter RapZ [Moraxella bovis]UZA14275.1 RNase adapter RapZ [Moraxella bovis]UZA27367.1 RNase adapter RapZ [Moraxella bovis]
MSNTQIIIVSGRSGSGKTSVLNILEDFGFYVIDNLPLSLVGQAVDDLIGNDVKKVALGVDVRTPKADLSAFESVYQSLTDKYHEAVKILYVTAQESVLVARFGATRRVHPLMPIANNLPNALAQEIELLKPIATNADIKIDTSTLNIHELKEKVRQHIGVDNVVSVNVLSFGFKHGTPIDADFVFDVRILPNPHWQENLRPQTGLDDDVKDFFANYPEVDTMADDIGKFLIKWLPNFLNNNRYSVMVAIGCTGGKHRSVYITQKVGELLKNQLPDNMPIIVKHREKRYW